MFTTTSISRRISSTKWKTDTFTNPHILTVGKSRSYSLVSFALILLLLLAHLPFLTADPDIDISYSRGPFTDEGQNTVQVRNWINHGLLDIDESDNLLKTPLFGFSLALPYIVFGTKLIVSRLWVLLLVILALAILARKKEFRLIVILLIPMLLFKYQLFQFSHFSLAEMLSVMSVTLSIFFFSLSMTYKDEPKKGLILAVLSSALLSFSYFFKIQFIYILPLLPLLILEKILSTRGKHRRFTLQQGIVILSTLLSFLLIYLLGWYLPNKDTYDYMMVHQSGAVALDARTLETIRFNLRFFFFTGKPLVFTLVFLASLLTGTVLLFIKTSMNFRTLFLGSLIWFILELHKLAMVYLPTRYQVSLYFAMGLLMATVISEVLQGQPEKKPWLSVKNLSKHIALGFILLIMVLNLTDYFNTLQRREYVIRDTNRYLAGYDLKNRLVIGAWAPSLTWECKSRSFPVWYGFLNYQDPLHQFDPAVIVAENDEKDSEEAYRSQGINLMAESDSVKFVRIGRWTVGIFWMQTR